MVGYTLLLPFSTALLCSENSPYPITKEPLGQRCSFIGEEQSHRHDPPPNWGANKEVWPTENVPGAVLDYAIGKKFNQYIRVQQFTIRNVLDH